MKYHCAVTLPINPPSALPTLTITQVWEGLIVKAREPQSFVPISECTITEDRGAAGITRRVKFVEGKGPVEGYVTEVITYHKPMKVDFRMIDGPLDVSNIISSGQNDDLYLTFTAFVEFPGIEEGSAEAIQRAENTCAMFRTGVQHSIEGIRKMAAEGRL